MTLSPLQKARQQILVLLQGEYPGEHPYTLALRLQRYGHTISGKQATHLLNHHAHDTRLTKPAQH